MLGIGSRLHTQLFLLEKTLLYLANASHDLFLYQKQDLQLNMLTYSHYTNCSTSMEDDFAVIIFRKLRL